MEFLKELHKLLQSWDIRSFMEKFLGVGSAIIKIDLRGTMGFMLQSYRNNSV